MSGLPDWTVSALDKDTGEKAPIGGGWTQTDGSIAIVFNPFVTVPVGKQFGIRLFPRRGEGSAGGVRPVEKDQDEIPF